MQEQFGSGVWGSFGTLRRVHTVAMRVVETWVDRGGPVLRGVETNQVWVDLEPAGIDVQLWSAVGSKDGVRLDGKQIVLHHQISEDAVSRLGDVFSEVLSVRSRL